MDDRIAVITGASSYAGGLLVRHLEKLNGWQVTPIYSTRTHEAGVTDSNTALQCDLRYPILGVVRSTIENADVVFHFAWIRGATKARIMTENFAMIENLLSVMTDTNKFVLISSAAAGPTAPSIYGSTKFAAEQMVSQRGGTVLSIGLISATPGQGAYAAIKHLVCTLPIKIHFSRSFRFFVATEDEVVRACMALADDVPGGEYAAFPTGGTPGRKFLRNLENACPRVRLPIWIPDKLVLWLIATLNRAHLFPPLLGEKLTTFLYLDADSLESKSPIPENVGRD